MEKETLLNKKQVCELLQCSCRQVDVLRERHGLPSLHVGGLIRFRLDSVRQWINDREQGKEKQIEPTNT